MRKNLICKIHIIYNIIHTQDIGSIKFVTSDADVNVGWIKVEKSL